MKSRLNNKFGLIFSRLAIFLLQGYQRCISPLLGNRCRFYPSCSQYGIIAIEKYGLWVGVYKTFFRLLKCHPFHRGGVDFP